MPRRRVLTLLLGTALLLPAALLVVGAAARLLAAMGDAAGAAVLDRLLLAGGIAWTIDLALLVIALGWEALARGGPPGEEQ